MNIAQKWQRGFEMMNRDLQELIGIISQQIRWGAAQHDAYVELERRHMEGFLDLQDMQAVMAARTLPDPVRQRVREWIQDEAREVKEANLVLIGAVA